METNEYKLQSLLQLALFQDYAQPLRSELDEYFAALPNKYFILRENGEKERTLIGVIKDIILQHEEDLGETQKREEDPRIQDVMLKNCPRDSSEIVGVSKKIEGFIQSVDFNMERRMM